MSTRDYLIEKYGLLLSIEDLSSVLKRSPDGLRLSLRGQSEFAQNWKSARKKIGRRVYFHAETVATLIDTHQIKEKIGDS